LSCLAAPAQTNAEPPGLEKAASLVPEPWEIRAGMYEASLSLGGGVGMQILGSQGHHDWVMGVTEFGWVFKDVRKADGSRHGSVELLGDLFGGYQFYEEEAYFVGVAPLLRYNFHMGGAVVPFCNLGAGLTWTDIRGGDLSTTFEFNLQGGGGAHFFLRKDLALTLQYRFIHLSNANAQMPNQGVNNSTFLAGVSCWW
jgi:hypothetical protein